MTTDWTARRCERCQVRGVGVRGPDPHLCDACQTPGPCPCVPCAAVQRVQVAGRCPHHDAVRVVPPVTDRDLGDEDDHPAPDLRFDLRDYRQSLIDQRWKG